MSEYFNEESSLREIDEPKLTNEQVDHDFKVYPTRWYEKKNIYIY